MLSGPEPMRLLRSRPATSYVRFSVTEMLSSREPVVAEPLRGRDGGGRRSRDHALRNGRHHIARMRAAFGVVP